MYEGLYAPLPDGQAYAQRIGLPWPLTPDLDTLDRIILAHQCTVPFENLQCYDEGQMPSLEIEALFEKVVVQHRGGFCFELNALLLSFLKALGYDAWGVSCCIIRGRDFVPPMLHRPFWSAWGRRCTTVTWDTADPSPRGRCPGRGADHLRGAVHPPQAG